MQLASIKAPGNDRFVGSSIDNTNDEEEGEAEEDDDMDDSGSQGFEQEEDEVEVRDGSFSRTHVLSVTFRVDVVKLCSTEGCPCPLPASRRKSI